MLLTVFICHNLTPTTLIVDSDYSSHSSCNNYKIRLTDLEYKIKLKITQFFKSIQQWLIRSGSVSDNIYEVGVRLTKEPDFCITTLKATLSKSVW